MIIHIPEWYCKNTTDPIYSKRLELALKNFMKSMDGGCYTFEADKGVLLSYFRLNNGICVEQMVQIRKTDYVCYTTLSIHTTPEKHNQRLRFLTTANHINLNLDYGSFEIDTETGDIRYRTYYEPIGPVRMEAFDRLLGYPRHIINKYGHLFKDLL